MYLASMFITQMESGLHSDRYRNLRGVRLTTLGHDDIILDLTLNLYPVVNTLIAWEVLDAVLFEPGDSRVLLEQSRKEWRTELAKALNGDDEK